MIRYVLSMFMALGFIFQGSPLHAAATSLTPDERASLAEEATSEVLLDQRGAGRESVAQPLDSEELAALASLTTGDLLEQKAGQDPGEIVTSESPYAQTQDQRAAEEAAALAAVFVVAVVGFVLIMAVAFSA